MVSTLNESGYIPHTGIVLIRAEHAALSVVVLATLNYHPTTISYHLTTGNY